MDPTAVKEHKQFLIDKYRATDAMIQHNWEKKQTEMSDLIPYMLTFLPFGECNTVPMVQHLSSFFKGHLFTYLSSSYILGIDLLE
jgi:hypothetical protein